MLLAKTNPEQSLLDHSRFVCEVLKELKPSRFSIWEKRLQDIGFNTENLEEIIYFLVACHDLGKGMEPWQRYIRGQGPRLGHSLFSMLLACEVWPRHRSIVLTATLLAILSHHGQLHNNSSQDPQTAAMGRVSLCKEELNAMLAELGDFKPLKSSSLVGYECADSVAQLIDAVGGMQVREKTRFKALYCFFHALLRLADNEGSARVVSRAGGGMVNQYTQAVKGFAKSAPAKTPNSIQQQVMGKGQCLVLRAGCGVGKTGAALRFALGQIEAGNADRVIFTLPTQFTTNSMYWDLPAKYKIPKSLTGLYHSEIESVLKLETEVDNVKRIQKYQNTFYNKPVTISTVDHLLYSLLHCYKYADRAFGNIFTSTVVFDEVHYYDHFTLKKIGQCLELLRELQIPHMVMTATMPQVVLDQLQKQSQGGYTVITQQEKTLAKPYIIEKAREPIVDDGKVSQQLLDSIRQNRGSKQMVVVNKVALAKEIAKALQEEFPDANIICYHSQFCRCHRTAKEKLIKALFDPQKERDTEQIQLLKAWNLRNVEEVILVSTQVCELSLDISADIMYSQVAPADSIIQRGGRLHRKGCLPTKKKCNCAGCCNRDYLLRDHQYTLHLFPLDWEDEKSYLPYGSEAQRQLVEKSWQVLSGEYSFQKGIQWVDSVFTEVPPLRDTEMKTMILEDVVFGRTPLERYGDEDKESSQGSFRVRDIKQPTLTVIPACYENEARSDEIAKVYAEFGVKVPPWLFSEYGRKENKLWLLELPYSKEYGFEMERRSQ